MLPYQLGVDLGTTFTAAAIARDGRLEPVLLEHGNATIPSAVWVGPNGERLVGEAALRRGMREPDRLAREFKRRLGDDVPWILGGTPVSADQLMTTLLSWVIEHVSAEQGERPERVVVTHPSNWGSFRREILAGAAKAAGVEDPLLISEPEAAALYYASTGRIDDGDVVAVYDLGGGTFDVALLRRQGDGFEFVGTPDGVERLGGIDFDAAVFSHVREVLGGLPTPQTDEERAALLKVRAECRIAKEGLSDDTEVHITVLLTDRNEVVRLNRSEFEAMVRPAILTTIEAVHRTLASVDMQPADLAKVLLVGGSSRIPLVAELISAELGRKVAVDAHPKMAVSLGAAASAAAHTTAEPEGPAPAVSVPDAPSDPGPPGTAVASAAPEPTPSPARARPKRRTGLLIGAAVGAVALVGAAIAVMAGGGGSDGSDSSQPTSGSLSTDIPMAAGTGGLAAGFDAVWVVLVDGTVRKLDPGTGAETATIVVGGSLDDIVATDTGIWVTSEQSVHKIDPTTGQVVFTVVMGGQPGGLARTTGGVVVAVSAPDGTGLVQRVDDTTRELSDVASLPAAAQDLVTDGGVAWVAASDAKVYRVQLSSGTATAIDVGGGVDGLAAIDDSVWMTIPTTNEVVRVSVADGSVRTRIPVAAGPNELTIGTGVVWVTEAGAGQASAIDTDTDAITQIVEVGDTPDRLAVVGDSIWVNNTGEDTVSVRPIGLS